MPTSDKKVEENSTKVYGKTADYEIGQKVPFKLTGGMPSNIADFTTYEYGFEDTLSKGFDLDTGSIKVTVGGTQVPVGKYTVTGPTDTADTIDPKFAGGKDFSVMFTDLKAVAKELSITLNADTKVVVDYTATVNDKAEIKNDGNGNKSRVVYQKNVNGGDGEKGKTPDSKTWVFIYKLNTTKIDSTDKRELKGAKFKLYNSDKTKSATIVNNKITGWVDGDGGTEIDTASGSKFDIEGLDAGKYYLREIAAPTGYNLPDGDAAYFEFTIAAEHSVNDQGQGQLTKLDITTAGGTASGATADAKVEMKIENTSGSNLPKTGGMGTALFTVAGLAVMAAAGGGIAYRRRKANA